MSRTVHTFLSYLRINLYLLLCSECVCYFLSVDIHHSFLPLSGLFYTLSIVHLARSFFTPLLYILPGSVYICLSLFLSLSLFFSHFNISGSLPCARCACCRVQYDGVAYARLGVIPVSGVYARLLG